MNLSKGIGSTFVPCGVQINNYLTEIRRLDQLFSMVSLHASLIDLINSSRLFSAELLGSYTMLNQVDQNFFTDSPELMPDSERENILNADEHKLLEMSEEMFYDSGDDEVESGSETFIQKLERSYRSMILKLVDVSFDVSSMATNFQDKLDTASDQFSAELSGLEGDDRVETIRKKMDNNRDDDNLEWRFDEVS